ncbi:hypothetical protein P3W45_000772 [Vairimorpha bombi]|jgi:hypothetical protein
MDDFFKNDGLYDNDDFYDSILHNAKTEIDVNNKHVYNPHLSEQRGKSVNHTSSWNSRRNRNDFLYAKMKNTDFNFDNELNKKYGFSFSNNFERNDLVIDPRDIFTENSNRPSVQIPEISCNPISSAQNVSYEMKPYINNHNPPHSINLHYSMNNGYLLDNIYPQSSNLLINYDQHHRINPTNNSVLNFKHRFITPQRIRQPKKSVKKTLRLCVDGTALYNFKTFTISFNILKHKGGINDLNFLSSLNDFNEILGIMKVPFKYGTVLSFVFNELKKYNGYFNTSSNVWAQLSQVIKQFTWINQIYLFLVYPFEQYYFGHKKIRIFNDEKILNEFKSDFSAFSTNDIDICLSKGKISDLDLMMLNIDPKKIKIEGVIILLNFFVDIFQVKFENLLIGANSGIKFRTNEPRKDKYSLEERTLFEKLRKAFLSKISALDIEKSIYLCRRCIEISIDHGKICKKKYLGFNVDQLFLNKIFNLLVVLKENGHIEIEMILNFVNVCSKISFYENPFIFKYLLKLTRKDPVLTLEVLSNIKFSKNHNKKFLRRLRNFIFPILDNISTKLANNEILDDNKVLENIVRSFVCIKSMKDKFKDILKNILLSYDYNYSKKIYLRKSTSSDLFKIILVMMSHEDVKIFLYSDVNLMARLKKVPGIRDLV